jgi:hypothetical protein
MTYRDEFVRLDEPPASLVIAASVLEAHVFTVAAGCGEYAERFGIDEVAVIRPSW